MILKHSICRKQALLSDSMDWEKFCMCDEVQTGLCAMENFLEAKRKIDDDAKLTAQLLAAGKRSGCTGETNDPR